MKLLEYQAKTVMERFGVPIMRGVVIDDPETAAETIRKANLTYPVVIKAQVPIGGRGKAGGIQFAENPGEATAQCGRMFGMDIRGFTTGRLLITEKVQTVTEWYLSILLDRLSKSPLLIFSPQGGMEIEETARTSPEKIAKIPLDPLRGVQDYTIEYALDKTGTGRQHKDALKDVAQKLFAMFFQYYTMLTEINPLVIDASGRLIALDAKVEIDDNALSGLPDILAFRDTLQEDPQVLEARKVNFLFVPIDDAGTIGVMSNGSGMLMSCIDLISQRGMKVHAALDLGGGATAERISEAVRIMLDGKNIDTVFICIFGGITRCDEVAKGACLAMTNAAAAGKRLILRMEGTNKEQAAAIVAESGLPITTVEGIPNAVAAIYQSYKKQPGKGGQG
jgi:succinyl-CoA synthetase beta subunit